MASNNFTYNIGTFQFAEGTLHLLTDNLAVLLVTPAYFQSNTVAFLADANSVSDLETFELTTASVVGYVRQPVLSRVLTRVGDGGVSNGYVTLQAANVTFTALYTGNTVGGAVLIKDTGVNATSIPLGFYYIAPTPTNGGDVSVRWANTNTGGALKIV